MATPAETGSFLFEVHKCVLALCLAVESISNRNAREVAEQVQQMDTEEEDDQVYLLSLLCLFCLFASSVETWLHLKSGD